MCMESKKMVLMNLFAGLPQKFRNRAQTCGHRWGMERVGQIESVTETYTLPYVK